jgi:YfiH family protein
MGVELIRWDAPGPYAVAFSTRLGGVSTGAFASLNVGLRTDDAHENVEENRLLLCAAVGAAPDRLALNRQVHSAVVHRARAGARGEPGDGLWTDERGLPLLAVTADCVPVALARVTGERPALAILHVGWRGLLGGIVAAGVEVLGGLAAAAIGPGIGPCCYEVREDVAGPVRRAFGLGLVRDGRLDLPAAVERALRAVGVVRVDRLDPCTACDPDRFFSHRRDGGLTGRQGVLAYVA